MKNKYIYHSHISERKFREIARCFEHDFTSQETSDFTGISRVTEGRLYVKFRRRIIALVDESPVGGEWSWTRVTLAQKECGESVAGVRLQRYRSLE